MQTLIDLFETFAALGRIVKALAEFAVVRVDVELFACFGIFHDDWADIRQFGFAWVP